MTTFDEIVSHIDASQPVATRMRAIFGLKSLNTKKSIKALEKSLVTDPSALVRHEVAYVLGQMESVESIEILRHVLCNEKEDVMVRHEAGEAIGAIGSEKEEIITLLEEYSSNEALPLEITETCYLSLKRIKDKNEDKNAKQKDKYGTIDPIVPNDEYTNKSIDELKLILSNEKSNMQIRYQALFTLRNMGNNKDSVLALCYAMENESTSNLLKHEIAYVLGQIQSDHATDSLTRILNRKINESEMVRHEAAEALGAIASDQAKNVLKKFEKDKDAVVRESVQVALDIVGYVTNETGELHYADTMPIHVRNDLQAKEGEGEGGVNVTPITATS